MLPLQEARISHCRLPGDEEQSLHINVTFQEESNEAIWDNSESESEEKVDTAKCLRTQDDHILKVHLNVF